MPHWHASTSKMSKPHQHASQTKGSVTPVKSAISQVSHIAALAHQVHNSAMPLNQANTTSRQYCHAQGIVVKPGFIIPQGVKACHYCKRLTATFTDSKSAPTRAVCYDASMPATMLTVQHHKTIPNTKSMTSKSSCLSQDWLLHKASPISKCTTLPASPLLQAMQLWQHKDRHQAKRACFTSMHLPAR